MKASDLFIIVENNKPLTAENLPFNWVRTPENCPELASELQYNYLFRFKPFIIKATKGCIFGGDEITKDNSGYFWFRTKSSDKKYQCIYAVVNSWIYAFKLNGCAVLLGEISLFLNYKITFFIECWGQIIQDKEYLCYPVVQFSTEYPEPVPPWLNIEPEKIYTKVLNSPYITGYDFNDLDFQGVEVVEENTLLNSVGGNSFRGNYNYPFYEQNDILIETYKKDYLFNEIHGKDTGGFNCLIYIDGDLVNICDLIEQVTIEKAENSNDIAKIKLLKNCGVFDFYHFYNKKIDLFIESEKQGLINLFSGFCNYTETNPLTKIVSLNCISTVDDKINNLTEYQLSGIGFYSNKLFDNLSKKEEFTKRMESIPASFYLKNNTIFISDWIPKNESDLQLNCDDIFIDDIEISGLKAGEVVNKITLNFDLIYARKCQRNILVQYANGASLCDMIEASSTLSPKVEDLKNALNNAGWRLLSFSYMPLPDTQWTTCKGVASHWRNYDIGYSTNESGEQIMTKTKDEQYDYATECMATLNKWWVQEIGEHLQITIKNQNSIDFFNEKKEELNFSTVFRLPENDIFSQRGVFVGETQTAQNGDIYQNCLSAENLSEYNNALIYAINVSKTKIYKSHLSEFRAKTKLLAIADLNTTAKINTDFFTGNVKIKSISYNIDFHKKTAFSTFSGHFIKGFQGENLEPVLPERSAPDYVATVKQNIAFSNVYLGYSDPISEEINAVFFRERGDNIVGGGVKKYDHAGLNVVLPDIQAENTNALNQIKEFEQDISIKNTVVNMFVKC